MKRILLSLLLCLVLHITNAQSFLDFQSSIYYTASGNTLISSGQTLANFNYTYATGYEPIFNDGVYYPVVDVDGDNLWVRVRHIADDPNDTSVGVYVPFTSGSPFRLGGFGGWGGFLYQFDIYKDGNLKGAAIDTLNGLFLTNVIVESIETLSYGEWVSFEILNEGSTNWRLNSINFTGNNPTSNPGFSSVDIPWNSEQPPAGFSPVFPPATKNIYVVDYGSGNYYAEFKMNADNVSQFTYGYEFTELGAGYQGMRLYFGVPASSPTPLKLLSFAASPKNNFIQLNWKTAQENNTSFFNIESSSDGNTFKTIATKAAAGSGDHTYNIVDASPREGDNFYRLKMVDKDGNFTYSSIVKVHFHTPITLYTNPAKNILDITSTATQEIIIIDSKGTLMTKTTINSGYNSLDISKYAMGIYFLKTSDGVTKKFLKN